MAHILFLTVGYIGHINPHLSVIEKLCQADHRVSLVCNRDVNAASSLKRSLEELGVQIVPLPFYMSAPKLSQQEVKEIFDDPVRRRQLLQTTFIDSAYAEIEPVRTAIREVQPDLIALDPVMYSGVIAAHLEGIPYASISVTLRLAAPAQLEFAEKEDVRILFPALEQLFSQYNVALEFRLWEIVSPWLNIILATAEFVGTDVDLPPNTILVGPPISARSDKQRWDEPPFSFDKLRTDQPLGYVAAGTVNSFSPEALLIFAEAAARLNVQLVMSVGSLVKDTDFMRALPENVTAVPYAPQNKILERAAFFISHSGPSSVAEALYYGVPLLLVPLASDQPIHAHFTAKAKAGIVIAPNAVSLVPVQAALTELLDQDSIYRKQAAMLQRSFRAHNDRCEAANQIAQLAMSLRVQA